MKPLTASSATVFVCSMHTKKEVDEEVTSYPRIIRGCWTSNSGDLMAEKSKVKITVLKKLNTKQIFGDNPPMGQSIEACDQFKVGQEFIVGEDGRIPEGFCAWAWNDIYGVLTALRFGGNFPWMKEKGTSVSCCTDGLRPVIFELRRIE